MLLFLLPNILLALDVNAASRIVQNLVELAFEILPRIVWAIGIILLTRLAIIWISSLTLDILPGYQARGFPSTNQTDLTV